MKQLILINLSLLFIAGAIFAQGVSYNQEFQVNAFSNSRQHRPDVCHLSDGKFAVSWWRYYDGRKSDVYAQIFNGDGSKYNEPIIVNTDQNRYQNYSPSIEAIHGGKFIVAWHNWGVPPEYYSRISAQIYNNDGSKHGTEFKVNTFTGLGQYQPAVTSLTDGKFVICWQGPSLNSESFGIHGQIFNQDGTKYGENFDLQNTSTSDNGAEVTNLDNGKFIVYYTSNNIRGQIFNEDGSEFYNGILIEKNESENVWAPTISGLFNGKFIVCWVQGMDIWGQIFNNDGSKYENKFVINTNIENNQVSPCVSTLGDGKFVICWTSRDQDGSRTGVFGQVFYNDGSRYGYEFQINDYVFDYQEESAVSALGDSNFVVCWESYNQEVPGISIFGKYYLNNEINHSLIDFSLDYPANDETIYATTPKLNWQKPSADRVNFPWEMKYTLFLDEDENFSSPTIVDSIYDTTYTVQDLMPGTTYFWKVLAKNIAGDSLWSSETFGFFVDYDATGIEEIPNNKIQSFQLHANYPNPFNPTTTIRYDLPVNSSVNLAVYDISGRLVQTLVNEKQTAGSNKAVFNATSLSSGVYFYSIKAGQYRETKKMLLVR